MKILLGIVIIAVIGAILYLQAKTPKATRGVTGGGGSGTTDTTDKPQEM